MAIGIGINPNVVFKSININEKGTLELEFAQAGKETVKKSVFEQSLTARTNEDTTGTRLFVFQPMLPNKPEFTIEQKINRVAGDFTSLHKQLGQILEQFVVADQIDLDTMDVQYANTGIIDAASYESRILDQDVISKIYTNIIKRFAELMKPFINDVTNPVRLKLIRQSKDKHYATLPSRFITDNPFIEPMSVPEDQSKVKFSKWEIDNGLDSSAPVSKDTAEQKVAAPVAESNPFAPQ